MDVTRGPLTLVELGHEADRHPLLGGDLLGGVLVDHVLVGRPQGIGVAEVDLVLTEVALPLGVLDLEPGTHHGVADPPDQRLDPGGPEQRVIDVVEVGRLEVPVALAPGLLIGVAEDQELELGARIGTPAALGQAGQLRPEHLAWRGEHVTTVPPGALSTWRGEASTSRPSPHSRSARHMAVPSCQGTAHRVLRSGRMAKSPYPRSQEAIS